MVLFSFCYICDILRFFIDNFFAFFVLQINDDTVSKINVYALC